MTGIGVFHVDNGSEAGLNGYAWARGLVKSAHRWMPSVPVVHFTDLESRAIKGVQAVRRKPSEPMALLRMRHHAGVRGNWLFVDTDVIFQRNVQDVFEEATWDIAITTRTWPHVKASIGFTERMPFNTGVMFSRCPRFWADIYTRLRSYPKDKQQWMGDQEAICELVDDPDDSRRYQIVQLKGHRYNYPPLVKDPDARTPEQLEADAAIVHYKGERRKPMLIKRIRRGKP